jgi:two-component system OmpR family sensor kinase
LSFKKNEFIFLNTIVYFVLTSLILFVNFLLIENFILKPLGIIVDKNSFFHISAFLILIGVIIYFIFVNGSFKDIFKSDDNLQKKLKETLHEINTPVATILANTKMLEKNTDDEKNLKKIARIKQSCDNLLKLYEDMEYSIKQEIDKIELCEFSLNEAINESIKKFEDIKKDISIKIDIDTNSMIKTDKIGFERMIDNLISNSIKYNKPNGEINISYSNSILSIYDTGCGIDTKNLFLIFDEYFQENKSSSGYGLGLKIVKEFCDKNKIELKISSIPDKETTISLNLDEILLQS